MECPPQFRARLGFALPKEMCQSQKEMEEINKYDQIHEKEVNQTKCKTLSFNPTRRNGDFLPNIVSNGVWLENVEEAKMVGVHISSDQNFKNNTTKMVSKAFSNIWMLRRLKKLGPVGEN